MKISLPKGEKEYSLPDALADLDLAEASRTDLAVLLAVARDSDRSVPELSEIIGSSDEETLESLLRLQEKGLLRLTSDRGRKKEDPPVPRREKKVVRANTLPSYNTEQTANLLKDQPALSALFDNVSRILGRMLTTADKNTLLGFVDYLSLREDFILLLISYCNEHGHSNLRYAEQVAVELSNQGVTDYRQLEEYLISKDKLHSGESKIRSLFGIGSRSFSKSEEKHIRTWLNEWELSLDMIEYARDEQVRLKGGLPTFGYVNSILQKWHEAGYTKPEDIPRANGTASAGTFDTTDFFDAALNRAYGNKT